VTERILAAFVPLVDCAVLVAAREQGFAAAEGFDLELVKEPSWASLRDHLSLGYVDCAHALAPLPVALSLGVGYLQVDCGVPFVLSRGGNAITVAARLFDAMQAFAGALTFERGPAAAGGALAAVARRRPGPLTFGMVFPFSNHNFDLRYWLASAGLHPDRDVRLVAIPPPLMVETLRAGLVDGFCVGEPWNSLAVAQGLGCIVATQSQLFPHAVEKVLVVGKAFERAPERLAKLLRALNAAAEWADDPQHYALLAKHLARPKYLGAPADLIETILNGRLQLGAGREAHDPDFIFFHRHAANLPDVADADWAYAQMVRWGQVAPSAEGQALASNSFRPDLYRRCIPVPSSVPARPPAFDRIAFVPGNLRAYLDQFDVHTPFQDALST
jgi:ABC-type nitrate/sulfonate/bicarbonate transport system substrate-binding protein